MPGPLGVEFANFPFVYCLLATAVFVIICVEICHLAGKAFSEKFVSIILWVNFALHFLKQLNPFYAAEWPYALARSTGENLCAVLVMAEPFLWKWGGKYAKDYMYYMGIISTLVILIYPTSLVGIDLHSLDGVLECFRFYSCHAPLLIVAIVMVREGFHKLNYHRLWAMPLMFCFVQAIIFLNGLILNLTLYHQSWLEFIDVGNKYFNSSFTMGPGHILDPVLGWLYPYLPPILMTYRYAGDIRFVPVVYLFIPVSLLTALLGPAFAYPFDYLRFKSDWALLKQKRRLRKASGGHLWK